jgi:uncharacterized protein YgfB (UPF0149 family)
MSDRRQLANRTNASKSTGPITANGKTTASANAMRHGILSGRLCLENEDPAEFQQLQFDLHASLGPVGTIECALVERIAIAIWRQRRLVAAETASLNLNLDRRSIAKGVNAELDRTYSNDAISEADLQPYDIEQERWCKAVVAELEGLDDISLEAIRGTAPLVLVQLKTEADDDQVELETYLDDYSGGLLQFVSELLLWCQKEIKAAEQRPVLIAMAKQVEARRMLLPRPAL